MVFHSVAGSAGNNLGTSLTLIGKVRSQENYSVNTSTTKGDRNWRWSQLSRII
jgi:hypothetical protein